ncbi:MAG: 5-formyltetrahydrofolate cyclo-ligase [Desulfobulbaceae bacterium]|nr:5-formyltetrahydrofolate cyclo-ligase [Desulfobulbaceae bacterium]
MIKPSLIRKTTLAARDSLSFHDRQVMSDIIVKQILLLDEIKSSETLFIYVAFRSEVETLNLIKQLLLLGKKVVVPVTLVSEKRLLPVVIRDVNKDLLPGYCSILEPRLELRTSSVIESSQIDTIFLPGAVFDEQGGRMGYGGGFYDRFMAYEAPLARRIGLAFEVQVIDKLYLQAHDKILDLIVTENRLIQGIGQ